MRAKLLSGLVVLAVVAGGLAPLPAPLRSLAPEPAAADSTTYRDAVVADSPGAYWRLNESSGNFLDATANHNDAAPQAPLTRQVASLVGGPDTATGFGGYGTVPDSPSVSPTTAYTLEAWIKPTTVSGQMGIIEHYGTQITPYVLGYNGFGLRVEAGGRILLFNSGSVAQFGTPGAYDFLTGATVLQAGQTYHVVGTYDGASLRIYLNGLLDASMSATFAVSDSPLPARLGASGPEHAYPFNGALDELAVYDHALAPARVQAHYLATGRTLGVPKAQARGSSTLLGRRTTTRRADPVDTATGSFVAHTTDLAVPGAGVAFSFSRTYNSDDPTTGPLGQGWTASWLDTLAVSSAGDATVHTDEGADLVFVALGGGAYQRPPAVTATLAAAPAGGWDLVRPDRVRFHFDAAGRLASVVDPSGVGVTLARDGAGRLTTATDAAGRAYAFSYDGSGRLTTVSTPSADGRSLTFAYTGNLLSSATDVRGGVTTYEYDGAGRLTNITDPEGSLEARNTYDADGRVIEQLDPLGNATTFAWDPATQTSTMTDPKGQTWVDVYSGNVLTTTTEPNGTSSVTTDGDLNPTGATDPNGKTWSATYDAAGNLVTRTAPAPLSYVETWTYDANNNPLTYLDGRGNTTSFAYDASGRLTTTTYPGGAAETRTHTAAGQVATFTDARSNATTFAYDPAGNLTSLTSPTGAVTTWTYDGAGRPLTRTEPRGNAPGAVPGDFTTTWTYDASGNVLSETDALGRTTTSTYDANNLVLTRTDPAGRVTAFTYNDAGELVTETAPGGRVTTNDYDSRGQLVAVTSASGAVTTYGYDGAGRRTSMVEPRGNAPGATPADYRWTYGFDAAGNPTTVTDPLGHTTTSAHDALGRRTSSTDANGHTTTWGYDAASNRISAANHLGQTTTWSYDARNRATTTTDPVGKTWASAYDGAGNVVSETTPTGSVTTRAYDADGRLAAVVDPLGNAPGGVPADHDTTYAYDLDGHLVAETDPLGATVAYGYDRVGRRTTRTDANGHATTWGFDALGRLTTVTAPGASTTTYAYDTAGDLVTRTDANNHATTYAYDADARLVSRTSPAGQRWTYGYDAAGHRTTTADARANAASNPALGTTTATYDRAGRLVGIDYSDATPDVSFGYDAAGNRTSMSDGAGTETRTYDGADRLSGVVRGADTFSYAYDAAGRVISRTYPGGAASTLGYDDDGRLATVAAPEGTTTYAYDSAGRLATTVLPNGVVETRAHDNADRVAAIVATRAGATVASFAYSRDPVGNPTQVVAASGTQTYTYDDADRLTSVCHAASCAAASPDRTAWTYDHVGNRLSQTNGVLNRSYAYDAADRLTSSRLAGTATNYGYDANGNQTSVGLDTYAYDLAGRMTTATSPTTTWAYLYDGDGKRLRTTTTTPLSSTVVADAWDLSQPVAQLATQRDGAGALTRRYTYGLARISTTDVASASYYHADALGSVARVTGATGGARWSFAYEPFGAVRTSTHDDLGAPDQPMRFAGEALDATGLYHLRARQYDPGTGRFTATDPLAPDLADPYVSSYVYANARPGVLVDPTGEKGRSVGGPPRQPGADPAGAGPGPDPGVLGRRVSAAARHVRRGRGDVRAGGLRRDHEPVGDGDRRTGERRCGCRGRSRSCRTPRRGDERRGHRIDIEGRRLRARQGLQWLTSVNRWRRRLRRGRSLPWRLGNSGGIDATSRQRHRRLAGQWTLDLHGQG